MNRTRLVLVTIGIVLGGVLSASAYMGGPLIVELLGYEPVDGKVYYWLHDRSEASNPRRTFYFDLKGSTPAVPVHALSLDVSTDSTTTGAVALRWIPIQKRLRRLEEPRDHDMRITVHSDSVGLDNHQRVVRYRVQVDILTNGKPHTLDLEAFCHPTASIHGVYRIPTRDELLVVLTYLGRAYGCEEVQLPVILPMKHAAD